MVRIIWFPQVNENRNNLLKYSFMKLHKAKKIEYIEKNQDQARKYNVERIVKNNTYKEVSFFLYCNKDKIAKILVDSNDSFFQLCPLIKETDIYFCAGYSTDFFEKKAFIKPYEWQTEEDVFWYKRKSQELINEYGNFFPKVRKFIPVPPGLTGDCKTNKFYIHQKLINIRSHFYNKFYKKRYWEDTFRFYQRRYSFLLGLREQKLKYDIILRDTLWGWPDHRIKLHKKLQVLSNKYKIKSLLKWSEPTEHFGNNGRKLNKDDFPVGSNIQPDKEFAGKFEVDFASSKLAVLATGFHWGWRNIMTLALMLGLPIYMDKPILESYFDLNEFRGIFYNINQWEELENILDSISPEEWNNIKKHNQRVYDKYLSPEAVGNYVIREIQKVI